MKSRVNLVHKVSRLGLTAALGFSFVLVSQSAFAKGAEGQGKHFAQMDTNKDGGLSLAEMQQAALTRFAAQDTNKDGFLSAEEMQAGKNVQRAGKWMQKRMEKQDTNKDNKISKAEVQAMVSARFALLDTNKDGVVKADEMKAHHGQHGKRGQQGKKGQRQNKANS
jgi:Ca2+-binding EF-hand superfamily protein